MPDNTLSRVVETALHGAETFLRTNPDDKKARTYHTTELKTVKRRLIEDIEERSTTHLSALASAQEQEIKANWDRLTDSHNEKYARATDVEKSLQAEFDKLKLVNGGALPRNISPVLYAIPLIGVGTAEYYINYSTFAASFVPIVAIFATLFVGFTFAVASHLHGAYLKQLAAINHPSVRSIAVLDRRIAVSIATVVLLIVFITVVYLRYSAISSQLGLGTATAGTFGQPSQSLVWSRLGPTLAINLAIWALGTLYSWSMHERVPGLRDAYQRLLRQNKVLNKMRKPFIEDENRIKAQYNQEREMNQVAIKDYKNRLGSVNDIIGRIEGGATTKKASAGEAK